MTGPVGAVATNLTDAQRAAIVTRFTALNPHWTGAHADDILDALADSDSDLAAVEPFWEAHPELSGPRSVAYAPYATRALIWSGTPLTIEAVRALITAARTTDLLGLG
jgi:hypothetical protein